jgi:S-formylglutathione hydrolase FrmB
MHSSLLNQNVVVFCSLIAACLSTFIVTRLRKKWYGVRGLDLLIAGVVLSFGVEGLTHLEYPSDSLPTLFWLMVLPFPLSGALIAATWKNKRFWLKYLAIGNALFCLLFSLILMNGYYNYFPTVGSVFNEEVTNVTSATLLHTKADSLAKNATIEGSLYDKSIPLNGAVKSINIPGVLSKFKPRGAYVYIPPIALQPINIRLPVIVLSAGYPGQPDNWIGSGLQTTVDQFAALHHGVAPYVFMVDNTGSVTNDTECVNSPRGNLETYLTTDVPNYIKAHYNVATSSAGWAVGGLSMGGMCSMMLALRHPGVYNSFIDLGGEVGPEVGSVQTTTNLLFHGSEQDWAAHQPLLLMAKNKYSGMNAFFADGNGDGISILNGLKTAYNAAKAAGINSVYEEVNGGHTFMVWQETFKNSLPWISNRLGATECSAACQ